MTKLQVALAFLAFSFALSKASEETLVFYRVASFQFPDVKILNFTRFSSGSSLLSLNCLSSFCRPLDGCLFALFDSVRNLCTSVLLSASAVSDSSLTWDGTLVTAGSGVKLWVASDADARISAVLEGFSTPTSGPAVSIPPPNCTWSSCNISAFFNFKVGTTNLANPSKHALVDYGSGYPTFTADGADMSSSKYFGIDTDGGSLTSGFVDSGEFTVLIRLRRNSVGAYGPFIETHRSGDYSKLGAMLYLESNHTAAYINDKDANVYNWQGSVDFMTPDFSKWYDVSTVYKNRNFTFYLNGTHLDERPGDVRAPTSYQLTGGLANALTVGVYHLGTHFDGTIGCMGISQSALNPVQLNHLFSAYCT